MPKNLTYLLCDENWQLVDWFGDYLILEKEDERITYNLTKGYIEEPSQI